MKEGRVVKGGFVDWGSFVGLGIFERGSFLYGTVWLAVISWVGLAPVAQFLRGPSCGQGGWGACRSKGTVVGEHVPDRFGEAAGDLDGGDFGAAFAAVAGAHPFDGRLVVG